MKRLVFAATALLLVFAVAPMARADEIDDAFKRFRADDGRTAAEKIPALKAFIEARQNDPNVLPLVSLLGVFAEEAGDKEADKWGTAIFDRLRDKLDAASASEGAENAAVSVPVANVKTKTVTLPGGATMEMIYCPPGTYMMGTPESEPERQSKETLHKVKLTKGFWLGKYEVTQAQWESVMGANPSKNKNAGLPVENVTWEECDAFCRKVGGGARFPTEAEWEYACRAGTKTAFYWGTSLNGDRANCKGDSSTYGTKENGPFVGHMTKGGTYGENPWGFCDMSGNVEEWCSDWYDLIGSDEAVDPKGPDTGNFRIVRGGYWRGMAEFCRSGRRGYGHPKAGDDRRGFRMAMDE